MNTNPGSGRAGNEAREPASPPRAITYDEAEARYRCTIDARERFEELVSRDLLARAYATLKARGTYDPHLHGDAGKDQPLTVNEHLEILAAGEMLARYYRHPARVHEAVLAGAPWSQVAAATGSKEAQVRQAYRAWADGQHRLYIHYQGEFGMNEAEHAAAISRAAEPQTGAGVTAQPGSHHGEPGQDPVGKHDQDWAGPGFTRPGPEPAAGPRGNRQAEAGQ
jgi:hypothetical protein